MRVRYGAAGLPLLAAAFNIATLIAQNRVDAPGRVVDSVTGNPVPNLHLHMGCSTKNGRLGGEYDAVSDAQGAFTFTAVPYDVCGISVDGHELSSEYSSHPNGVEKEEPWIIRLVRSAKISGRVTDENGNPLFSAEVYLGTSTIQMGRKSEFFARQDYSDQQGRFHFEIPLEHSGLQIKENRYRLCAQYSMPGTSLRAAYPLTCFPDVRGTKAAEWIEMGPGDSREVNFRLIPVTAGGIAGHVLGSSSLPPRVWVTHLDRQDFLYGGPPIRDPIFHREDSTFQLSAMEPGTYRVRIEVGAPGARLTDAADVVVRAGEVSSVELKLTPEPVLSGRVRTDDGSPFQSAMYRSLTLRDSSFRADWVAEMRKDGSFQMTVRKLETYQLDLDVAAPWHIVSATLRGRDVFGEGLKVEGEPLDGIDIVLSRAVGSLEVSALGSAGGCLVLLRRFGTRLEDATNIFQGQFCLSPAARLRSDRVPAGSYWAFLLLKRDVPYLESDFLDQHKDDIRSVEVRPDVRSLVELEPLRLP